MGFKNPRGEGKKNGAPSQCILEMKRQGRRVSQLRLSPTQPNSAVLLGGKTSLFSCSSHPRLRPDRPAGQALAGRQCGGVLLPESPGAGNSGKACADHGAYTNTECISQNQLVGKGTFISYVDFSWGFGWFNCRKLNRGD